MRIGIDARSLGPAETGPGIYARQLIDRMAAAAADSTFFLYWARREAGTKPPGGANIVARDLGLHGGRKAGNLLFEQVLLPAGLRSDRCDLLWSPAFVLPLRKEIPQVVTMHDVIPLLFCKGQSLARRLVYHRLLRINAQRADCVLTVSHASARDLVEHLGIDPANVRVIWNGLEEGFSAPMAAEEEDLASLLRRLGIERPYVLGTAGLLPRKNAHGVLEAFARSFGESGPARTLVLTGKPDSGGSRGYVAGLREQAIGLGLEERVRLTGFLPRPLLRLLYGGALFSIDASFYEGFGFPVIESMACGCPVITSDCSSLPEIAGDAALLVEPRANAEIADAMSRLAGDQGLRSHLREAGLRRAACFSWEESAARTLDAFRGALAAFDEPATRASRARASEKPASETSASQTPARETERAA